MRARRGDQSLAEAFYGLRADYDAAKTSRFRRLRTGVSSMGSGADWHYRSEADYLRMMEQARDMDRNDVIVGQTIDRAVQNTIQNGFTLNPMTGDKQLDSDLWQRFNDWAEEPDFCDAQQELCFKEMEELVLRQMTVDGDHLALPLEEGSLQLVEAHRLRTPSGTKRNVVHGVLLDENRRRLQYWLTKEDIDPMRAVAKVGEIQAYDARDAEGNKQVFHVYNPKRVSQTRGVTALAPIFNVCGMFEDINFARMVQQQVVSCFAIFRLRAMTNGTSLPSVDSPATGALSTETQSDGTTRTIQGIAPGMEITGAPGEQLQGFSPRVPNAEFFQHVRLILTLIGINLGMPLVEVLMDASETNFSGFRGAIDEARRGYRRNQRWLARRFHRQVYLWKVRQWIAQDAALRTVVEASEKAGGKINVFAHEWKPPSWPYIEPNKDAMGDQLQIKALLNSPRAVLADKGRDWEQVATETVADNSFAIRAAIDEAKKLRAETGTEVDWREVLFLTERELITTLPLEDPSAAKQAPKQTPPDANDDDDEDEEDDKY